MEQFKIEGVNNAKLTTEAPAAGALFNARAISQVWLWDTGPSKPKLPARPEPPQGKEGSPAYDLAKIEFAEVLADYQEKLKQYAREVAEFGKWEREIGGPIGISMWSVDARDALANDARAVQEGRQARRRYYMWSRTRGYGSLPNHGLPEGMTPGRKHAENLQRERDGDTDMIAAVKRDPIFGEQELRQ